MTNWEKYFGTPEKTVITLTNYTNDIDEFIDNKTEGSICGFTDSCRECPIQTLYCENVLEWLQEEAS